MQFANGCGFSSYFLLIYSNASGGMFHWPAGWCSTSSSSSPVAVRVSFKFLDTWVGYVTEERCLLDGNSVVLAEDQCAGCSSALDQDDHVRRLRIEATKRLILDRLQMDDRPSKIDANSRISFPSTLNPVSADDEEEDSRDVRQLILFPTKIWPPKRSSRSNNSLLKFHITPEMRLMSLHSAVLWTASQEDAPVNSTEGNGTCDIKVVQGRR
jgi:hypothetical protein